jgi:basic membrane lipoprotein Med (substrate-binding protein (PBP1-ABC) superfamily)
VWSTGHHRDLTEFAPKAVQCSSVWVWDQFLEPEIKKIADGTWEPSPYGAFFGLGNGIDIACCGDQVSEENKAKIMAERQAIIDGKHVFAGPLKAADGTEKVAAGAVLGDGDLWAMDWYVPGVISQQ